MIKIDSVLQEQIRLYGAKTYKKFLYVEVFKHWNELVGEDIAAYVEPVKIEP